jgi:hypothetical protein
VLIDIIAITRDAIEIKPYKYTCNPFIRPLRIDHNNLIAKNIPTPFNNKKMILSNGKDADELISIFISML